MPEVPMPPRDWLKKHSASSQGAAGNGWQVGWGAGYLAGLQAATEGEPTFDKVRAPAAAAKLYVLAVLDEMGQAVAAARAKYVPDLSGEEPFKLLLATEEWLRQSEGRRTDA